MSIRAAATQLGMVAGAALGGAALAAGGYGLLGAVLSILFAAGAVPHLAAVRRSLTRPERLDTGVIRTAARPEDQRPGRSRARLMPVAVTVLRSSTVGDAPRDARSRRRTAVVS